MLRPALFIAALPLLVPLAPAGAGSAAPEAPSIIVHCYANARGLGVCSPPTCPALSESCDAAHPCSDGEFCAFGTGCDSNFTGVCKTSYGACSNPGTAPASCDPLIYGEDFATVGAFPSGLECGGGADWFKEEAAACGALAPTPNDHLRWGIAPGDCTSYGALAAGGGHRTRTQSPVLDISSCPNAVIELDYLVELDPGDGGVWDRAFLTLSVDDGPERVVATSQPPGAAMFTTLQQMSCEGGVAPVGNLFADGTWRHFRIGVGPGGDAVVRFYGEVVDNVNNDGRGWLVDDFRVDCGDFLFGDGFEGTNVLRWSDSDGAPLLRYTVEPGGTEGGGYLQCAGPDTGCLNYLGADGQGHCINQILECGATCVDDSPCEGGICIVGTSCPGGGSTCAPSFCDPSLPFLF